MAYRLFGVKPLPNPVVAFRIEIQWKCNHNTITFIPESAFKIVICKMSFIFFSLKCVSPHLFAHIWWVIPWKYTQHSQSNIHKFGALFILLQFDTRRFYPYVSVFLLGHWNHHIIVLVPVKQPWKLWINSKHVKNNHDVNAKNQSHTNMSRDGLPMFKMNFLLIKYIIYYIVVIAACCAISRNIEHHYTLIWLS